MDAKKIELVRQLLAKAESTTPEEAEALTAAAEKIMIRLGIDDAMLAASGKVDDSPIVAKDIKFTGPYRDGMVRAMYQALTALQTCSAVNVRRGDSQALRIFGRESQVDRAISLLSSLEIQAIVAVGAWWRAHRDDCAWYSESEKRRARRQFIISFGAGAAARIESERSVAESESIGSALALRDEVGRANDAMHAEYGQLRTGRRLKGGSASAAAAGRTAGRRANVGTTQLANRKQIGGVA